MKEEITKEVRGMVDGQLIKFFNVPEKYTKRKSKHSPNMSLSPTSPRSPGPDFSGWAIGEFYSD